MISVVSILFFCFSTYQRKALSTSLVRSHHHPPTHVDTTRLITA